MITCLSKQHWIPSKKEKEGSLSGRTARRKKKKKLHNYYSNVEWFMWSKVHLGKMSTCSFPEISYIFSSRLLGQAIIMKIIQDTNSKFSSPSVNLIIWTLSLTFSTRKRQKVLNLSTLGCFYILRKQTSTTISFFAVFDKSSIHSKRTIYENLMFDCSGTDYKPL